MKKTKEQLAKELRELRNELDSHIRASDSGNTLPEEAQKYRLFFENTSDSIYLINPETGQIVECNPRASLMTGYTERELLSMSLADLCPVEEQDILKKIILKIAGTGTLSGVTGISQRHKDGNIIPIEINGSSVQIGRNRYCLLIFRDITERKLADEALKASEEKYRALFKHMFIGSALHRIIVDSEGRPVDYEFIEVNDAFERLTGLKRHQLIGKKVTEVIPGMKKEKPELIRTYGDVALRGEIAKFELQFTPFNKWFAVSAYSPRRGYFVALFDDITHRKYWEEKLRESEQRFRDISENAREWIWEVNAAGKYVYSSPVVENVLGYTAEEIREKHFYDLFHPDDRESLKNAAFEVFARKEPFRDFVNRNIHKNGSIVWLSTSGIPLFDGNNNLIGYRGADSDVTVQKQTEERLLHAQEEWEVTFDTIPDLILITDTRNLITRVNRAMAVRLGMKREALIGKTCYEVIHKTDEPPSYCPHSRMLAGGDESILEVSEDNLKGHFIISASPIYDTHGNRIGVIEVARDITERKEMELQLQRAATTDSLTGLLNRRGFLSMAEQQIRIAKRSSNSLSLMFIDVDNMKEINDRLGHAEGDRSLKAASRILRDSFRESDIIGRIGGDEFAVLMTINPDDAGHQRSIMSIEAGLKKHNARRSSRHDLSISIGHARFDPARPCSLEKLMAEADSAMYRSKKQKDAIFRQDVPRTGFREKRSHPRFSPEKGSTARLGGSGKFPVMNISMGGICLEVLKRLPRSGQHQVTFKDHRNQELRVPGTVVRSDRKMDSDQEHRAGQSYATALQFSELTDAAKKSLQNFLKHLAGRQ